MIPCIAVVNQSSLPDEDVALAVLAVQKQIDADFGPAWGLHAELLFPVHRDPLPTEWRCTLLDGPEIFDPPDALGYHDVDLVGVPYLRLFVGLLPDPAAGLASLLGHEVLEAIIDPFGTHAEIAQVDGSECVVLAEVGDPVEQDAYPSPVNGLLLTNFVYPAWFRPGSAGPWDHMGTLCGPLTKTAGGYWQYAPLSGGWVQQRPGIGTTTARAEGAD